MTDLFVSHHYCNDNIIVSKKTRFNNTGMLRFVYTVDNLLPHLKPFAHLQQPLFKGRQDPSISRWSNVQQKVSIAADSGHQLVDELCGIEEHVCSLSAVVAPGMLLDRVAALPLIGNQVAWTEPVYNIMVIASSKNTV